MRATCPFRGNRWKSFKTKLLFGATGAAYILLCSYRCDLSLHLHKIRIMGNETRQKKNNSNALSRLLWLIPNLELEWRQINLILSNAGPKKMPSMRKIQILILCIATSWIFYAKAYPSTSLWTYDVVYSRTHCYYSRSDSNFDFKSA